MNMRIKNYLYALSVAFAMAFAFTACGDDDPIGPTPEPKPEPTPDPTPEVVYNGYGCAFSLDSLPGDAEAFQKILLDSMQHYCPQLKEVSAGVYAASLVYEEKDTAKLSELKNSFRAFWSSMVTYSKTAVTPVVTSKATVSHKDVEKVSSDWKFDLSSTSDNTSFAILVPRLKDCLCLTDDPKDSGIVSLKFGSWLSTTAKAMFSSTATVNRSDSYDAVRSGDKVLLMDEDNQLKYGFVIDPSGKSLTLVRIGTETLDKDAWVTYRIQEDNFHF